jgi:hypothetical protein
MCFTHGIVNDGKRVRIPVPGFAHQMLEKEKRDEFFSVGK